MDEPSQKQTRENIKTKAIRDFNPDMIMWAIVGLGLLAIATFAILTLK